MKNESQDKTGQIYLKSMKDSLEKGNDPRSSNILEEQLKQQKTQYYVELIKLFEITKKVKNKNNLDILIELNHLVLELKEFYEQSLNSLSDLLYLQISNIQEEEICMEKQLQESIRYKDWSATNEQSGRGFISFKKELQRKFDEILSPDLIQRFQRHIFKLEAYIPSLLFSQEQISQEMQTSSVAYFLFQDLSFSCPFHNQMINFLFLSQNAPKESRLVCNECPAQMHHEQQMTLQLAQLNWNEIIIAQKKQMIQNQEILKQKYNVLQSEFKLHQHYYQHIVNTQIQELSQKFEEIEENYEQESQKFNKRWFDLTIQEVQTLAETLSYPVQQRKIEEEKKFMIWNDQLNQILNNSIEKIKDYQQAFVNQFMQFIAESTKDCQIAKVTVQENILSDPSVLSKQQNYRVINNIEQNEVCNAMAMNKQSTIVVGCGKSIKIFEFVEGKLKQIQQLNDHTGDVTSLYFLRNTNQFISGSADNSIRFWGFNGQNQYECITVLKNAHQKQVNQILAAKNEEILISCSSIVKFWNNKPNWNCWQKVKGSMDGVYSMSLNESQDTLITTGYHGSLLSFQSGQICVIKPDHQGMWQIVLVIKTRKQGYKICFINNRVFAFSKEKGGKLHLYEYNDQQKQHVKSKFIKIDAEDDAQLTLLQTFNQEKQLIVNQHGKSINLIKVKGNQEFEVTQNIKFQTNKINGVMSDNGQYLVTWDNYSQELIVRAC